MSSKKISKQKSPRKEARRPVWAEVDLSALAENFRAIRKFVNPPQEKRKTPRKILCIVKGNGYGHGGPQVAKALEKAGSDWFGVTCTEEGIAMREAGVRKPVLVLTSFWAGEESRLIEHDLTAVIHRCEQLKQLDQAAARFLSKKVSKKAATKGRKRTSFHLKMDTGMNRLGIAPDDVTVIDSSSGWPSCGLFESTSVCTLVGYSTTSSQNKLRQ